MVSNLNLTNEDFNRIERALRLLPYGEEFDALPKDEQDIIVEADETLLHLLQKQKKNNERIAKAIAEKRITDPGYARSKKEKEKYHNG